MLGTRWLFRADAHFQCASFEGTLVFRILFVVAVSQSRAAAFGEGALVGFHLANGTVWFLLWSFFPSVVRWSSLAGSVLGRIQWGCSAVSCARCLLLRCNVSHFGFGKGVLMYGWHHNRRSSKLDWGIAH